MEINWRNWAVVAVCTAALAGVGYAVYFDHKRRNDAKFRKTIKKQKKDIQKKQDEIKTKKDEDTKDDIAQFLATTINQIRAESLPTDLKEREIYFTTHLSQGEVVAEQGPSFYREAAVHFFKAIKACPSPVELIMILQKALPAGLYSLVVSLFTLDMRVAQNKYFTDFPSVEHKLKLIPDNSEPESELPSLPHHLEASDAFTAGQTIFTEKPISSSLIPSLEGKGFCSNCLSSISGESLASNIGFWKGTYCSEECRINGEKELIETGKVGNEYNKLFALCNNKNAQIPSQIARLLVRLFNEKEEQLTQGLPDPAYSNMDHIERHAPLRLDESSTLAKEASFLRDILSSKTPGVDQLITDEYYMMIKGRFLNSLLLVSAPEGVEVPETSVNEDIRRVSSLPAIGSGFYVIGAWILPSTSTDAANVKLSFEGDKLTVTALRDIAIGETIRYEKIEASKAEDRAVEEPTSSEPLDTEQMIAKFMDIMSSGELVDFNSDVETDQNSMVFLSSPEEPAAELESTSEETPVEKSQATEVAEEAQPAATEPEQIEAAVEEIAAEEPATQEPTVEAAEEKKEEATPAEQVVEEQAQPEESTPVEEPVAEVTEEKNEEVTPVEESTPEASSENVEPEQESAPEAAPVEQADEVSATETEKPVEIEESTEAAPAEEPKESQEVAEEVSETVEATEAPKAEETVEVVSETTPETTEETEDPMVQVLSQLLSGASPQSSPKTSPKPSSKKSSK